MTKSDRELEKWIWRQMQALFPGTFGQFVAAWQPPPGTTAGHRMRFLPTALARANRCQTDAELVRFVRQTGTLGSIHEVRDSFVFLVDRLGSGSPADRAEIRKSLSETASILDCVRLGLRLRLMRRRIEPPKWMRDDEERRGRI